MENLVERTDFYSLPVQDMERAKAFYRDVLGMHSPNWDAGFPEIETGNVSLYLTNPAAMGMEFSPTPGVHCAACGRRARGKARAGRARRRIRR